MEVRGFYAGHQAADRKYALRRLRRRVRQALEKVEGVQVGDVHVGGARVEAPETVPVSTLVSAVEKAGYPATVEA